MVPWAMGGPQRELNWTGAVAKPGDLSSSGVTSMRATYDRLVRNVTMARTPVGLIVGVSFEGEETNTVREHPGCNLQRGAWCRSVTRQCAAFSA